MKENLVIKSDRGGDVTTSLLVAEVFGKEHKHVLRDIDELSCSEDFRKSNFGLMFTIKELPNGGSRKDRYYEITKDGFSFLVMGYTGAKAAQFKEMFIAEFNRREALLKSDDYILMRSQQILQKRLDAAEQRVQMLECENEAQKKELQEAAPKVTYYDSTLQSVNTLTTTQIAKELGLDAPKLNQRLKQAGVIFRQSGMWMLRQPYSSWNMTATRTQTYTRSDGSTGTSIYTVWNERGRRFIHALHDCDYNARNAVKSMSGKGGAL